MTACASLGHLSRPDHPACVYCAAEQPPARDARRRVAVALDAAWRTPAGQAALRRAQAVLEPYFLTRQKDTT